MHRGLSGTMAGLARACLFLTYGMGQDWRLGAWGISVYPAGTCCGPRHISDWELVWIVSGDCVFQIDGVEHALPPRSVILVPPGAHHAILWDREGYTRHGYVHFSMPTPDPDLPPIAHWPRVRRPPADGLLQPLLDHVIAALAAGDQDFARHCVRLALCSFVSGRGCEDVHGPEAPPLIEAAFAWLADRWVEGGMRQLPLTDLARAVAVSPGHLDRVFRRHLGISPMEAQRRLRLDRVGRLVRDGGQSVQGAAAATGFASPFHCARRFRACYGMPPSALRGGDANGAPLPPVQPVALAWLAERVWRRVGLPRPVT